MLEQSVWRYNIISFAKKALTREIKVIQLKTEEQLIDIFAKGFNSKKLEKFQKELGMTLRKWIKDINNEGEC